MNRPLHKAAHVAGFAHVTGERLDLTPSARSARQRRQAPSSFVTRSPPSPRSARALARSIRLCLGCPLSRWRPCSSTWIKLVMRSSFARPSPVLGPVCPAWSPKLLAVWKGSTEPTCMPRLRRCLRHVRAPALSGGRACFDGNMLLAIPVARSLLKPDVGGAEGLVPAPRDKGKTKAYHSSQWRGICLVNGRMAAWRAAFGRVGHHRRRGKIDETEDGDCDCVFRACRGERIVGLLAPAICRR